MGRKILRFVPGDPNLLGTDTEVHRVTRQNLLVVEADDIGKVFHFDPAVVAVQQAFNGALEEVCVPDEGRYERGSGSLVDLRGGADLLNLPRAHHRDPVAQAHGLPLVMGDVEEGDTHLVMDQVQLDQHSLAELQVQGSQGFVQKKDLGLVDQGPGDGDTLFLPSAQLVRLFMALVGHLNQLKHLVDFPGYLMEGFLGHLQAEGDVLPDRHVGKECVVLKDRVHLPLVRGKVGNVYSV